MNFCVRDVLPAILQRALTLARKRTASVLAPARCLGRTKGKTENGVGYVKKKNAMAGHSFASWEAFEAHLAEWEREVANVRIHGTTARCRSLGLRVTRYTG